MKKSLLHCMVAAMALASAVSASFAATIAPDISTPGTAIHASAMSAKAKNDVQAAPVGGIVVKLSANAGLGLPPAFAVIPRTRSANAYALNQAYTMTPASANGGMSVGPTPILRYDKGGVYSL